jgi:hypothetical protein
MKTTDLRLSTLCRVLAFVSVASTLAGCGVVLSVGEPSPEEDGRVGGESNPPALGTATPEAPLEWSGPWEWLAPQTTTNTLRAARAFAADDIWLVGDGGTVLRWDGKSRAQIVYQGPLDASYRAIAGRSAEDVWVAGDHAALHFNGTSWTSNVRLATLDVRSLERCEDGRYFAVDRAGQIATFRDDQSWLSALAGGPALDVTCAPGGGFFALREDGVDRIGPINQRVASIAMPAGAEVVAGRLLGADPASFRYVFAYVPSGWSQVVYGAYSGAPGAEGTTQDWSDSVPKSKLTDALESRRPTLGRIDADRLFVRLGDDKEIRLYDGTSWRSAKTPHRLRAGATLPSGEAVALGEEGMIARFVAPSYGNAVELTALAGTDAAGVRAFSVARDGSAWGVRGTVRGTRTYEDTLGVWKDATGWQWHSIPPRYEAIVTMAPLSRQSAWLVLRAPDEPNPKYAGGHTLARWNGSELDVVRSAPKSIALVSPDREGGFFALATDGVLFHASADGALHPLADAGTAGESDLHLCTPRLAPLSSRQVWVLDQVCRLSLWDGERLVHKPGPRVHALHSSGWVAFDMWASSAESLWMVDPHRGLIHLEGEQWKVVWASDGQPHAVWGVDDRHVWVIDQRAGSPMGAAVLRMWDGVQMQTVASTPSIWSLGGSSDSVWAAGNGTLRLRAQAAPSDTR